MGGGAGKNWSNLGRIIVTVGMRWDILFQVADVAGAALTRVAHIPGFIETFRAAPVPIDERRI